jgi:hypothetical protein
MDWSRSPSYEVRTPPELPRCTAPPSSYALRPSKKQRLGYLPVTEDAGSHIDPGSPGLYDTTELPETAIDDRRCRPHAGQQKVCFGMVRIMGLSRERGWPLTLSYGCLDLRRLCLYFQRGARLNSERLVPFEPKQGWPPIAISLAGRFVLSHLHSSQQHENADRCARCSNCSLPQLPLRDRADKLRCIPAPG